MKHILYLFLSSRESQVCLATGRVTWQSPRSEDRFKNVRGQKADHGDDYAVADQVIGFVVIFRQHVVLRQAHQTGRFSWR
jgi:hypothetical protein